MLTISYTLQYLIFGAVFIVGLVIVYYYAKK